MANLRLLVLSDLHMHQGVPSDASSPSYLSAKPEFANPKVNPIQGAIELLEDFKDPIDWVVCPGDIGNKQDGVSALLAWKMLESMRRRLHIRKLIGTVGNHDVDSRRAASTAVPDEALKHFEPRFPISSKEFSERFWAKDYVVWKDSKADATLALVNTCSLHGLITDKKDPEHHRGYVTDSVLAGLAKELPTKLSKFNVLVMHHHIRQHPWTSSDESHAINGPKLVELLKRTGRTWLVVHGHQHLPNLSYSDGSPNAPAILSAGSAAAKTYPVLGKTPRNQLYLVEFDDSLGVAAAGTCARVLAWNWTPTIGWTEAGVDSGLPRLSGFGVRDVAALAKQVIAAVSSAPAKRVRWEQLVGQVPEVQFLVREDLESLVSRLEKDGVTVDYDRSQIPSVFEGGV